MEKLEKMGKGEKIKAKRRWRG